MKIRRYKLEEINILLNTLEQERSIGGLEKYRFSRDQLTRLLSGNLTNLLFCLNIAWDGNTVLGGICGQVQRLIFSDEMIAMDHLLFIREEYRSPDVLTGLVTSYVNWAKERKVREVWLRNVTGDHIDGFAILAEQLGFRMIGTNHAMEI